jgi:hypothetical protein
LEIVKLVSVKLRGWASNFVNLNAVKQRAERPREISSSEEVRKEILGTDTQGREPQGKTRWEERR